MERVWTDPRDGKSWHIYPYSTAPTMATGGQVPDAGEQMIGFRHPSQSDAIEGYAMSNPDHLDPQKLTDSEVQALLDEARKER